MIESCQRQRDRAVTEYRAIIDHQENKPLFQVFLNVRVVKYYQQIFFLNLLVPKIIKLLLSVFRNVRPCSFLKKSNFIFTRRKNGEQPNLSTGHYLFYQDLI